MSNIYDVLYESPELDPALLFTELEAMAQQLVRSGRLRIDARDMRNFATLSHPDENIHAVYSRRELTDQNLIPSTMQHMEALLERKFGDKTAPAVQKELARLQKEMTLKAQPSADMEINLARIFLQSAHPAVIKLLLWEEVQVFISYAFNIGDVLSVEDWQSMGSNSGMQSTAGRREYCVYVSTGGDPFIPDDYEHKDYSTDGFPAMARMMVIAGQEIGHFADIRRNAMGQPVARHSADIGVRRASDKSHAARQADIVHVKKVAAVLESLQMAKAVQLEQEVEFYAKHRPKDRTTKRARKRAERAAKKLLNKAQSKGLRFLKHMPVSDNPATKLSMMIDDMAFNLAPVADVYRNADKEVENAIACAEALARVPQQVVKWGHKVTQAMMPQLYKQYYGDVTPACRAAFETLSGQKLRIKFHRARGWYFRQLWRKVRNKS